MGMFGFGADKGDRAWGSDDNVSVAWTEKPSRDVVECYGTVRSVRYGMCGLVCVLACGEAVSYTHLTLPTTESV